MNITIPVICDRCRAEGLAGFDGFAGISDILDFDPVPRRPHADGWTPELQRAFIAALAVTGAPSRAARAIGKHAFGAEQLRKARGGRSFAAAWDAALDIYRERERHRLHDNLAELSQRQQQLEVADPLSRRDPEAEEKAKNLLGAIQAFGTQYYRVVSNERESRRDGKVENADFYLRQLTHIEFLLVCGGVAMRAIDIAWRAEYHASWPPPPRPEPDCVVNDYLDRLRKTAWARADGEEAWPYGEEVDPSAPEEPEDATPTALPAPDCGAAQRTETGDAP
jgi:hypothetical protein